MQVSDRTFNILILILGTILGFILSLAKDWVSALLNRAKLSLEITELPTDGCYNQLVQIKIECKNGVAKGLYITINANFSLKVLTDKTRVQTIYSAHSPNYEIVYANLRNIVLSEGHIYIEQINISDRAACSINKKITITVSSNNAKTVKKSIVIATKQNDNYGKTL